MNKVLSIYQEESSNRERVRNIIITIYFKISRDIERYSSEIKNEILSTYLRQ